ncbi:MAG: putative phenylacetic acid degradation-related protein [Candidatus Binatia bacterium]|nr:MAG: putative phenylacetic acid degradation-related protein [Candidatus Binatia bacterium]
MNEGGTRNDPIRNGPLTSGFDRFMGVRFVSASRDEVVLEYDVEERHLQPYGIVHGGMHCATIETACSTGAGLDALERGQAVVGVENHTSFIRAVRSGTIRVTAKPITRGRRTQLWEATARDAQGQVIATGRVRLLCLEPGTELGGQPVTRPAGSSE